MIVTEFLTQANDFAPLAQPSTALVGFTGIVNDWDKLYACLTDGRRHWIIACEIKHLQDFAVFREHIADSRGACINHPSQYLMTAWERAEAWDEAVKIALERGREK